MDQTGVKQDTEKKNSFVSMIHVHDKSGGFCVALLGHLKQDKKSFVLPQESMHLSALIKPRPRALEFEAYSLFC